MKIKNYSYKKVFIKKFYDKTYMKMNLNPKTGI